MRPRGTQAVGLGLGVESLGEVQKLVAAEAADRIGRTGYLFEAVGNRHQQLIANQVTVHVIHALKVVEVQQQHGT